MRRVLIALLLLPLLAACGGDAPATQTPVVIVVTATPAPPTATPTPVPTAAISPLSPQGYITAATLFAEEISASFQGLNAESKATDKWSSAWQSRVTVPLKRLDTISNSMLNFRAPAQYQDADAKFKEAAQDFKEFAKQYAAGMAEGNEAALQPAFDSANRASTALGAGLNLMKLALP